AIDGVDSFVRTPDELKDARVISGESFLKRDELFRIKTQSFLSLILATAVETDEEKKQQLMQSEMSKKTAGFETAAYDAKKDELVFVGMFGAEVLNRDGTPKNEVKFQLPGRKLKMGWLQTTSYNGFFDGFQISDLNKDGENEFIGYGGENGL